MFKRERKREQVTKNIPKEGKKELKQNGVLAGQIH